MIKGEIKLFSRTHELNFAIYADRYERNKVIDYWRILYGQNRFKRCHLIIIPKVNLDDAVIKSDIKRARETRVLVITNDY